MKKIGFTLLLFVVSVSSLKAQDGYPTKGDVSVLAKIDVNGAIQVGDDMPEENLERIPAVLIGGNVDYFLSSRWSLRGGLIYEQRKFKSTLTDATQKASYLTVPLTGNVHLGGDKRELHYFQSFCY